MSKEDFAIRVYDPESNIDDPLAVSSLRFEENNKVIALSIQPPEKAYFKNIALIEVQEKEKIYYEFKPYKRLNSSTIRVEDFSHLSESEKAIAGTAGAASITISVASLVVAAVSIKLSMELLKLYQMFEFLVFLNVPHPTNVKVFLSSLKSGAVIDYIPDVFSFLHNDNCLEMGKKFNDEEMSCQNIGNLGGALLLFLGFWLDSASFNFNCQAPQKDGRRRETKTGR